MTWLATRDDLTGHLNRMALPGRTLRIYRAGSAKRRDARLSGCRNRPARDYQPGFTGIMNDADEVIAETGKRLGQALQVSDLIGRTAGNKFGILVKLWKRGGNWPGSSTGCTTAVNGKTVETTARRGTFATVSIGAVFTPQHAEQRNGSHAPRGRRGARKGQNFRPERIRRICSVTAHEEVAQRRAAR